MNRRTAVLLLLTAPATLAQQPKAPQKGSTLKTRVAGDWNLITMSDNPGAGRDPRGVDRSGFMRLGKDQKFSIQIFPPKSFAGKQPPVGRAWTLVGTYEVSEKPMALDLHVTDSTFPNIGKGDHRRQLRLTADRLVITNPKPPKGWSAHWIWARAKK